jgi:hypothetical protein
MRRRDFILGGIASICPLAARAQQASGKVAHIAYLGALSPTTLDPRQIEQFKAGLAENGLIEGQNIVVDYLWGEGSTERIQQLATELGRRDLDVIVTAGPQPVRALLATGMDQYGPSAQHVNRNERRGRRGRSAGARASKLWPGVEERALGSLISTVMSEAGNRSVPEDAKRSRAV